MNKFQILTYQRQEAVFRGYDPRTVDVAEWLIQTIEKQSPRLRADHIGSTAVPGCGGKGLIDLAVTYLEGDLELAKSTLAALGFQPQSGPEPFPETRPMRVAGISALGSIFQAHAHVLGRDGAEHRDLVGFRDALRRDDGLRRAYESDKQRILATGVREPTEYSKAKGTFILSTLAAIPETLE